MLERPLHPSLGEWWSVSQALETINKNEGKPLQRGSFTYTVQRVDDYIVELHTHRVIKGAAGIRGFVLVAYTPEMGDGPVLALPYVIVPPGDGEGYGGHPELENGTPVVIDSGYSDIEGPLEALEGLLMDDRYADECDPLDWALERTTHGPALG